jgi:hypothetical protein
VQWVYCEVGTEWLNVVLEGNMGNMAKLPLRNGVICVMTDGMCSMSAVYVCDNTFHLKASQQSTSSSQGKLLAVKEADVISAS